MIKDTSASVQSQSRTQVGLAPMEGVTEFPARIWFQLCSSPDFLWTPFLRVTDSFPAGKLPVFFCPELDNTIKSGAPVIPQLMASNSGDFCRVAEIILNQKSVHARHSETANEHSLHDFVDLNCGCPSPLVVGGRAGSALLENSVLLNEFIESIVRRLGSGALSVKVRTGFHDAAEFPDILSALSGLSLAGLTVHGRTRRDRYSGHSRTDLIQLAADRMAPVRVTGSGDICDLATFRSTITRAPGASRWIVGRGALRNPWIFSELKSEEPVQIDIETILVAIQIFAMLHELYWNHGDILMRFWRDGVFDCEPGCSIERWQKLQELLDVPEATPGRRACARTKMLWNYLRSSLPEAMRDGAVLRATSVEAMVAAIRELASATQIKGLQLKHDPAWDWVYSGAGKP